jgi:hypothetical protein
MIKQLRQEIKRKRLEMNIFKLVLTMSVLFTLNNSFIFLNMANNYDFFVYHAGIF